MDKAEKTEQQVKTEGAGAFEAPESDPTIGLALATGGRPLHAP